MISLAEYMGPWLHHADATPLRLDHAAKLIEAVNDLMLLAIADGVAFHVNPATKTQVSGAEFGGFRPQDCPIGAPGSAHKSGLAVDIYDPLGTVDGWCLLNQDKMEKCGIYIEAPESTLHWSHWTIRAPSSGNRVFKP